MVHKQHRSLEKIHPTQVQPSDWRKMRYTHLYPLYSSIYILHLFDALADIKSDLKDNFLEKYR